MHSRTLMQSKPPLRTNPMKWPEKRWRALWQPFERLGSQIAMEGPTRMGVSLRPGVELLILAVLAWLGGVLAYGITLLTWYRDGRLEDLIGAAAWAAPPLLMVLPTVYLPSLYAAAHLGLRRRHHFAILGAGLAILPMILLSSLSGGMPLSYLTPENTLFGIMFLTSGAIFGLGCTEDDP